MALGKILEEEERKKKEEEENGQGRWTKVCVYLLTNTQKKKRQEPRGKCQTKRRQENEVMARGKKAEADLTWSLEGLCSRKGHGIEGSSQGQAIEKKIEKMKKSKLEIPK